MLYNIAIHIVRTKRGVSNLTPRCYEIVYTSQS
jgi:hypothetical protein